MKWHEAQKDAGTYPPNCDQTSVEVFILLAKGRIYLPIVTKWLYVVAITAVVAVLLAFGTLIPFLVMTNVWIQDPTKPDDPTARIRKYPKATVDALAITACVGLCLTTVLSSIGQSLQRRKRHYEIADALSRPLDA